MLAQAINTLPLWKRRMSTISAIGRGASTSPTLIHGAHYAIFRQSGCQGLSEDSDGVQRYHFGRCGAGGQCENTIASHGIDRLCIECPSESYAYAFCGSKKPPHRLLENLIKSWHAYCYIL